MPLHIIFRTASPFFNLKLNAFSLGLVGSVIFLYPPSQESLEPTRAALADQLTREESARQESFLATKSLQAAVIASQQALKEGSLAETKTSLDQAFALVDGMGVIPPQPARQGAIAGLLEDMVSLACSANFFATGRLMRRRDLPKCMDDHEYLGGCLAFAQDLGDYALGRCMAGDAASVALARGLVEALNGQLMQFDFRNGPLRRKFDGLKYALKRLEDLLFEQSLLAPAGAEAGAEAGSGGDGQPEAKRARASNDDVLAAGAAAGAAPQGGEPLVDEAEFAALREAYEAADAAREAVIKGCRDGQKLAKTAIYSVHRGELAKAAAQAEGALAKAAALTALVDRHPTLRPGSYTALLEEYAEAALFLAFARDQRVPGLDEVLPAARGFGPDAAAYLGGLVDLTGEVGRLAVAHGTGRRGAEVARCVEAAAVVGAILATLPPSAALRKKGGAVGTNLRKMGQVQYELSLAARGRHRAAVDTAAAPPAGPPDGAGTTDEA